MGLKELLKLPRIGHGDYPNLPLPWIAQKRDPGMHDPIKQRRCANEKRCSGCGRKMTRDDMAFILDEVSLYRNVEIIEPPLHAECARAAVRMCPHLRNHDRRLFMAYVTHYFTERDSSATFVYAFWFRPAIYKLEDARTGEILAATKKDVKQWTKS